MNITQLFDQAWVGAMQYGGIRNLTAYARTPKLSANARVMRHFMHHQRQLQNAQNSGKGTRETMRRLRQTSGEK